MSILDDFVDVTRQEAAHVGARADPFATHATDFDEVISSRGRLFRSICGCAIHINQVRQRVDNCHPSCGICSRLRREEEGEA